MKEFERDFLIKISTEMKDVLNAIMVTDIEEPALNALGRLMLEVMGEFEREEFERRFAKHFYEIKTRLQDNLYSDALWEVQKFCNAMEEISVTESENYQTANKANPLVRQQVLNLTDGHCSYCDVKLGDDWHVDHVVPVSQGGPDSLANYIPACPSCNVSKNGSHVLAFIKRQRERQGNVVSIGAAS